MEAFVYFAPNFAYSITFFGLGSFFLGSYFFNEEYRDRVMSLIIAFVFYVLSALLLSTKVYVAFISTTNQPILQEINLPMGIFPLVSWIFAFFVVILILVEGFLPSKPIEQPSQKKTRGIL